VDSQTQGPTTKSTDMHSQTEGPTKDILSQTQTTSTPTTDMLSQTQTTSSPTTDMLSQTQTTSSPTPTVAPIQTASLSFQNLKAEFKFNRNGSVSLEGISGFNDTDSYFLYHIHENPVGVDGNCGSTGKHYNPTKANYTMNPPVLNDFNTFEVGDLSGKYGYLHGNENGTVALKTINDQTLAAFSDSAFDKRSLVIYKCSLTVPNAPAILNPSNSKCVVHA
jgi:Cu/Zn superoxide dismutase